MKGSTTITAAKAIHPLVQYAEVWVMDDDAQSLLLQGRGRIRGNADETVPSVVRLKNGEGPAGMSWHQRRAIILQEAPSELLTRLGLKNGVELSALVAFPVLQAQQVRAVVVLGIGNGPGAFEVWNRDDRDELSVSAGYYSGLKKFEFISRFVRFPKGAGLPGSVWKSGDVGIASDLPQNDRFMRSFAADDTELNTGLGLPVGSFGGHSESVLVLLSSHSKPIANVFEIWKPESTDSGAAPEACLRMTQSDYSALTARSELPPTTALSDSGILGDENHESLARPKWGQATECDSAIADCWNTGLPVFSSDLATSLSSRHVIAGELGLQALLAVPVYRGTERTAVVVMLF